MVLVSEAQITELFVPQPSLVNHRHEEPSKVVHKLGPVGGAPNTTGGTFWQHAKHVTNTAWLRAIRHDSNSSSSSGSSLLGLGC